MTPRTGDDPGALGDVRRFAGPLAALLLFLAAVLPYLPSLTAGFAFDDGGLVRENPAVGSSTPRAAWTTPYWPDQPRAGLYRPWVVFSWWVDARLTGRDPAGFHAGNLLLHAAVVLVLWSLLRRLFPARAPCTYLTALVFALHPLHSEAVAAIVGRAELWASLWGLLAYRAALAAVAPPSAPRATGARRLALPASAICFALALLSKESAAGLLLLPLAHAIPGFDPRAASETGGDRRRRWVPVAAAWALAILVILAARQAVLGAVFGLDRPSLSDNALAHAPAVVRALAALGFQWILVLRTLLPWTLAADYSYPQLVASPAWMAAGGGLLLLFVLLAARAWRRRDDEALWGGMFLLAAGVVTSNVLVPVGTVLAERLAYLPSVGSLWLLAIGGARLHRRLAPRGPVWRALVPLVAVLWGVFLCGRTLLRNQDWKGDLPLFRATVEASPRSAKAWSNLAVAQLDLDRVDEALRASQRALALLPGYPAALEVRATALTRAGRAAEAVPLLRPALRDPHARSRSLVELGNAFLALSQGASAESAFAAASRIAAPGDFHPAVGLASAYALQGRWTESEAAWSRATALAPGNRDVRRSWAYALWRSGSPDRSESVYREILQAAPGDASTLNDFAWFLLEARPEDPRALPLARRAFAARADQNAGDTLFEALRRTHGCHAARAWVDSLASAGVSAELVEALRTRVRDRCNDAPEPLR